MIMLFYIFCSVPMMEWNLQLCIHCTTEPQVTASKSRRVCNDPDTTIFSFVVTHVGYSKKYRKISEKVL